MAADIRIGSSESADLRALSVVGRIAERFATSGFVKLRRAVPARAGAVGYHVNEGYTTVGRGAA
ncbi:MAG: hypothetical protein H0V33_04065 [Acidimicrobiia bacterium]|jgi:hypothetical protein|nr:hypothetical protein [Acidimicrobiia bacterium]